MALHKTTPYTPLQSLQFGLSSSMKFARHLHETQIPEWKEAYIDFKGLKKQIGTIWKAEHARKSHPQPPRGVIHPRDRSSSRVHKSPRPIFVSLPQIGSGDEKRSQFPSELSSTLIEEDEEDEKGKLPLAGIALGKGSPTVSVLSVSETPRETPSLKYSTINDLFASLNHHESNFFQHLEHELKKVDDFYIGYEDNAVTRLAILKAQLPLLDLHGRLFHEKLGKPQKSWNFLPPAFFTLLGSSGKQDMEANETNAKVNEGLLSSSGIHSLHPNKYRDAQRKLRKAFQEFYRSLELLNDYKVLNLTGFRKALKKYEKVSGRPSQEIYWKEKIQPRRFAFSGTTTEIMQEVEDIFASKFECGDRREAKRCLKAPFVRKTFYFSVFRSGVYIGAGLPALVYGLYKSFQFETRQRITAWDTLLAIYGALFIPVIFSILLGINLITWSRARINFAFILNLDASSAIDIRRYFELPAILFATLCYAFSFSFLGIGYPNIEPMTWPLSWIVLALLILVNPFPILSRPSRYWFLKAFLRLLLPGITRVDFTEFWLADQLCSFTFSLTQIFTIGCAYANEWKNLRTRCDTTAHWHIVFGLLTVPYFIRGLQCIRRYFDSNAQAHLVNAGKYGSSLAANLAFYIWQVKGRHHEYVFIIWFSLATFSAVYHIFWDIVMDWSLIGSHKSHYFLRRRLIYTNNPLIYYFAMITNVIIRFIWIMYIPSGGLSFRVRGFIGAIIESCRRIQWNFFRLENEQIGNADQYQATRDVPLPYSCLDAKESETEIQKQPSFKFGTIPADVEKGIIFDFIKQPMKVKTFWSLLKPNASQERWPNEMHINLSQYGEVIDIK